MKFLIFVLSLSIFSTKHVFAQTCSDVADCINLVSKLTGEKYISDKDVKGKVALSENLKITKENGGEVLSEILNLAGYARIPSTKSGWTVINARDVRYMPVPHYEYGKDTIPKNYDHMMATIKLKNRYITPEISRNFRPFMSRYGRIIDVASTGTIIISDTGMNIHRLIELVKVLDKKPTEDEIERFEKQYKHRQKISELKAKNCGDLKDEIRGLKYSFERGSKM